MGTTHQFITSSDGNLGNLAAHLTDQARFDQLRVVGVVPWGNSVAVLVERTVDQPPIPNTQPGYLDIAPETEPVAAYFGTGDDLD